jgi:hypothetical protein
MPRYIVVSYDLDQQQTFFDLIEATDWDAATQIVDDVRDYTIFTEAITEEDLRRMLASFDSATTPAVNSTRAELAASLDSDKEFCRTCDADLSIDDGEGYDGECGNCADKTEKARTR